MASTPESLPVFVCVAYIGSPVDTTTHPTSSIVGGGGGVLGSHHYNKLGTDFIELAVK